MFDTHCHIQFKAFKDDWKTILQKCVEKDVAINTVGTQKDTSRLAVELAKGHSKVFASVGLHPIHLFPTHVDEEEDSFISREENFDENYYAALAQNDKVIGIGECGLDFFHFPKEIDKEKVFVRQKEVFLRQLNLAKELNKALIIHVRDAHKEMISLLKNYVKPGSLRGVVHCFTGDWSDAQRYLELGLFIGFTGVITFPPKKNNPQPTLDILEVVEKAPLEKIVVETDAPYLAPQAYRGQRCEPWMVEEVTKKIAVLRKINLTKVLSVTEANAKKLFNLV